MAIVLRTGTYGQYYTSEWGSSAALTQSQMETNAKYIYYYLNGKGWTVNAIAGILGNMQYESAINPGRWQGNNVGVGPAYGIVQWDPYSKYLNWCDETGRTPYESMDNNLARIIYELNNGLQYYATSGYPLSFTEFSKSTESAYYLGCAFVWNYERCQGTESWRTEEEKEALRKKRGGAANTWYTFLTGVTPPDPDEPEEPDTPTVTTKKKGMPLLMMYHTIKR